MLNKISNDEMDLLREKYWFLKDILKIFHKWQFNDNDPKFYETIINTLNKKIEKIDAAIDKIDK